MDAGDNLASVPLTKYFTILDVFSHDTLVALTRPCVYIPLRVDLDATSIKSYSAARPEHN